jgi:RimJ/RimL family protein N-acetyltransferase
MESMPYRDQIDLRLQVRAATEQTFVSTDWRTLLPVLAGDGVVLRELRQSDALPLHALLSTEEVSRFISPPPTTVEGFERFIAWARQQRMAGAYICFAITLKGFDTAIGLIQLRARDIAFDTAEWGFAIGSPFWGTGVFTAAATLALDFAFDTLETHRLEARASLKNGRGQGALLKLGAVNEGVLRKSLRRGNEVLDQVLYTILAEEWHQRRGSEEDDVRVAIH